MRTKNSTKDLEHRAAEALRTVLAQVSVIKVKEIRYESKGSVLADVDVLGHRHTLACEVQSSAQPGSLRTALQQLNTHYGNGPAIPVLIAPYLSPEAQAMCKESQAGFLDLEGNARLALGEVFIGKRAFMPHAGVAHEAPRARQSAQARVQGPAAA
jgi:hypothetical protein